MTVSVLMPQQPSQPAQREKESDLDKLLKGLQVANLGFGIYSDYKRLEDMKLERTIRDENAGREATKFKTETDTTARQNRAIITPEEANKDYFQKGYVVTDKPELNAIERTIRTEGLPDQKVFLKLPGQVDMENRKAIGQNALRVEGVKLDAETRKELSKQLDDFTPDKNSKVKELVESADSARKVEWLLAQEKPTLDQIALRQLFRMSGDVGAVRAEDLKQLGSSPAAQDQALLTLGRLQNGMTISPTERANLKKFTDIIVLKNTQDLHRLAKQKAKTVAVGVRGVAENDVLEMLNVEGLIPPSMVEQQTMQKIPYAQGYTPPVVDVNDTTAEMKRRGLLK